MTAVACAACGRIIPAVHASTAVRGMHPGCARRLAGRPARNTWEVQS